MRASAEGRLVMSSGPYLEADCSAHRNRALFVSGQDLVAEKGEVSMNVRVQCPNWINMDTVFLLVNGQPSEEHTYSNSTHPRLFREGPVRFKRTLQVRLKRDAHLIVITGHTTE